MSAWCQFQQVQFLHTDGIHTRNVAEGSSESLVLIVDDKGSPALDASAVTHFSLARAEPFALVNLQEKMNLLKT